ncbi:unnamed protein product, partial [Cladocopium goreaui]
RAQQTLKRWIEEAPKGVGRQKIFPELDLLVATNACVGHETEVPWFLLGSDASLRRPDDGVALATAAGALCGQGLEVEEMTSLVGRRATIPSQGPVRGFHKLETYGLELMLPCQLQTSPAGACFCGAHPCRPDMDFAKACCRDGRNVEWRGLGILTGEMRSNIAHFARDSLWLHGLLQRNETLEALGFPQRLTERVLTKLAATECIENGQCAKSRTLDEQHLFEMEALMEEVALDHFPALATWNAGEPSLDHPVCFEVLLQRWRPWAGDVQEIQSFRQSAMKRCKIPDDGMQKKILLLKRESFSRRWKDEAQVIAHFKALAVSVGATFVTANLGRLTPCEQVGVLHNVMLMVGVHGADLTNMIFLPAKAAVLEIGVECELEGASVDSPFWRGPGTWMNHSILKYARESWKIQQQQGLCPPVGSILPPDQWLQGYPTSQFAKLARQANLLYSAVMDCGGAACHREQLPGEFDRGWCNSDVKKREWVQVDVAGKLIPTLWVIYDEYLRKLLPMTAVEKLKLASFDNLKEARQNRALAQRQVHGPNSFKQQVMAWYQALSLDALPPTFRDQMPKFVASLGSGPWMSGHRFGDSQLDVLAIWLGQTLASRSWKASVFLDFYMYSAFTENPGNQCYLHSSKTLGLVAMWCLPMDLQTQVVPSRQLLLAEEGFHVWRPVQTLRHVERVRLLSAWCRGLDAAKTLGGKFGAL